MRIDRARALIPWAFSLALAGCSLGRFDPAPAHGTDLTGSWVINHEASEDTSPILAKLRPRQPPRPDPDPVVDDPTGSQGGQRGGGQRGSRSGRGSPPVVQLDQGRAVDYYRRMPVVQMLNADIARSEHITIQQTPERLSLDYGVSIRNFTPGQVSVVSAEWGVAYQSSGWKGKDYVIRVKPQSGVYSEETFTLSPDGKRLTEHLRLGGGDYASVELHRVYDRTDRPLPRAAPNID